MAEWIDWADDDDRNFPLHIGKIDVRYRDGTRSRNLNSRFVRWDQTGVDFDIVAYRAATTKERSDEA